MHDCNYKQQQAVPLLLLFDSRQTSKTTHKYRWSVCDCNYKQQEEVCFLRKEERQTKIKIITAWLQITMRGVFSQDSRQTYKKTHEHRWSVKDCDYKERCFLRMQDKQKDPQIKMICAWLQLLFFFQDRWQTKTEKDPQIKICAWLQQQTTRRDVYSSGQRTDEQDQRSRR